jgi:hypothetical protein
MYTGPALVVVLRAVDAFRRLESIVCPSSPISHASAVTPRRSLEHVMSPTPELAYRLAAMFFDDRELFADNEMRPLLPYLPPLMATTQRQDGISDGTARPGLVSNCFSSLINFNLSNYYF